LARRGGVHKASPGVVRETLQGQADPLSILVDPDDHHRDALPDAEERRRLNTLLPGDLGTVHQAVRYADVDEKAVRRDTDDRALTHVALVQRGSAEGLAIASELLGGSLLREDQPVSFRIHFEHTEAHALTDERADSLGHRCLVCIDRADRAQLRQRYEPAHADVDDDTASVRVDHRRLEDLPGALQLLHPRPVPSLP